MIVTLTKKELEAIEKKEAEAKRRYEEARERARSLRPEAPAPPYTGEKDEDTVKIYEEWEKSGSDEWRKAHREEVALYSAQYGKNTLRSETLVNADEKLLKKITKSQDATVKELKRQVGIFLQTDFIYREDEKSGYFVPDFDYIRESLRDLFYKPMQTLDTEKQVEIENYIDLKAGELPPKVSSYTAKYSLSCGLTVPQEGTDSGKRVTVKQGKRKEQETVIPYDYSIYYLIPALNGGKHETTEERHTTTTPKDYVTTVDRISKKAFKGGLVRPLDADSSALWDVRLESHRSKSEVIARVAIDYKELIESGDIPNLPKLSDDDYDVHDAIISHLNAGNYAFTKTMLYRVMTGKMKDYLEIPEDAEQIIEDALLKFKGTVKLEYSEVDKDGNTLEIKLDEPLVTYIRGKGYLNGKYVDDLIILPRDERFTPPLLKWARFNHNEIDTRDVTLLDVKGLNNGKESRAIKMCLYRRLISMRNTFERKYNSRREIPDNQRSIRYDYIYSALGLEDPDKNKRRLVKDKIDRCMKHWATKGLVESYRHKRDGSGTYYAVEVSFMPSKE